MLQELLTLALSLFSYVVLFFTGSCSCSVVDLLEARFLGTLRSNKVGTASAFKAGLIFFMPKVSDNFGHGSKHPTSKCLLYRRECSVGSQFSLVLLTWSIHLPQLGVLGESKEANSILASPIATSCHTAIYHP